MSFAGLIELCAIAALGFAAATTLVCAIGYPLLRRRLGRVPPTVRGWALVGIAAAPLGSGVILTALAVVPSLLSAVGLLVDHCDEHSHAHAHLCLLHPPAWSGHELPWVLVGLVAAGAATTAARALTDVRRIERRLRAASHHARHLDARVVTSDTPLALTAGLLRHTVFVSSGLLRALSPSFLDVVMAHERAHVARHDALRMLLASMLTWFHVPWTRRHLLADLALAHEQACDDRAVRAVGSRVVVAHAIVAVERLLAGVRPAPAVAFSGGNVSARVERLLQDDDEAGAPVGLFGATVVAVLLVSVLAPVHDFTETLLHVVLGA